MIVFRDGSSNYLVFPHVELMLKFAPKTASTLTRSDSQVEATLDTQDDSCHVFLGRRILITTAPCSQPQFAHLLRTSQQLGVWNQRMGLRIAPGVVQVRCVTTKRPATSLFRKAVVASAEQNARQRNLY